MLVGEEIGNLPVGEVQTVEAQDDVGNLGITQPHDAGEVTDEQTNIGAEPNGLATELSRRRSFTAGQTHSPFHDVLGDEVSGIPWGQVRQRNIFLKAFMNGDRTKATTTRTLL